MNKYRVVAMIAASAVFVAIGFQNCSKVGVSDLDATSSSKVTGDGALMPIEDDGGQGIIQVPGDQMDDTAGNIPVPDRPSQIPPKEIDDGDDSQAGGPVVMNPPAPPAPPVDGEEEEDQPQMPTVPTVPNVPSTPTAGTPPPSQQPEVCEGDDCESESDAVALCLKADQAVRMNTVTGSRVGSAKKPLIVKSNSLEVIGTNGHGNLVVIAEGAGAKVSVTGFHGKLTICGMSGGDVIGGAGKVVVLQSKLDRVIGRSSGNVFVDSSSEIADTTGSKIKGLK